MKNIVIVGGSFAGHSAANTLAKSVPDNYRIVLIDANAFATHLPAIVRTLVVPDSERKNLTADLTTATVFPAESRHVVVQARVTELREGSIILDGEWEGSAEVVFDKCILATGAWQASPMRPDLGATRQGYLNELRESQSSFGRAERVLIVGGGAAGVEIAGELSTHFPDKKITLVHSHDRLLVTRGGYLVPEWVSERLHTQLEARGVTIHLNERVSEKAGSYFTSSGEVEADYVFWAVGNKPNAGLVKPDHLTSSGTVVIDDQFRTLLPNVYAAGDVCSSPGRKTAGLAKWEGAACASALLAHLSGKEAKQRSGKVNNGILVPLGDGRATSIPGDGIGAGAIDLGWFGTWGAPQWMLRWFAKDYFAKRAFGGMFTGHEDIGFE